MWLRLVTMGNNDPTTPAVWLNDATGEVAVGNMDNPEQMDLITSQSETMYAASADGAVDGANGLKEHQGIVLVTKVGSAAAMTLGQPKAGAHPQGEDGNRISFIPVTAFAHTVTTAANGINGNKHVLTMVPPNSGEFVAYNGVWYQVPGLGGTLS